MSSSPEWRIVSPAPPSAILALAGPVAKIRRVILAQRSKAQTTAVYLGDEPLAVAMFGRHGWRRLEMALAVSPAAAKHMRRLVRLTHLTLARLAETYLVVATVHPANRAGVRMARLVGFRLLRDRLWVFSHDGRLRRQQGEGRGQAGGRAREG